MPRLVLLNGAPGSGKSTLARLVGSRLPAVVLDVDDVQAKLVADEGLEHAAAKRTARERAVDEARNALAAGGDVVVTDYVVRPDFAEELAADAGDLGVPFTEIVLYLGADELARRLDADRRAVDARRLTEATREVLLTRPRAERVDASGSVEQTLARVLEQLEDAARASQDA